MTREDIYDNPPVEVIRGQILGKANNYQVVPGGRMIKSERLRRYEDSFLRQCVKYKGMRIGTRFQLKAKVYHGSSVYDLDNSLKTLLDCLEYAGAITNDNLCYSIVAEKLIDRSNPRVEFSIQAQRPQPTLFG